MADVEQVIEEGQEQEVVTADDLNKEREAGEKAPEVSEKTPEQIAAEAEEAEAAKQAEAAAKAETLTDDDKAVLQYYGIDPQTSAEKLKEILPNLTKRFRDMEAEKKRLHSQNKEISEKYRAKEESERSKQKADFERFKGMSKADRVREYLKSSGDVDFSTLPEGHLYRDDDYLESMYPIVKKELETMYPEPKAAEPAKTVSPELAAQVEQIKGVMGEANFNVMLTEYQTAVQAGKTHEEAVAVAQGKVSENLSADMAKLGHGDFKEIAASTDFQEWLGKQNSYLQSLFMVPSAEAASVVFTTFKQFKAATAANSKDEAARKAALDATKGVGAVGSGGVNTGGEDDDNLSNDEWIKKRNKKLHGG